MSELREDKDIHFKNFTRMSEKKFDRLLKLLKPKITKQSTQLREAIPSEIKLAITLRFLATGDSLMSLSFLFKVSKQLISAMLPDVLKAIIEVLKDYIKLPTNEEQWKAIANDFDKRWNFPHCIGAMDGKHVVIQRPENTVGEFHNYKGTHSIALFAIVDANYCFTYVNVGFQGRISDGGVFKSTSFYRQIEKHEFNLPNSEPLRGRTMSVLYVLVADDAYALSTYTLKPYSTDLNVGSSKRVYNYRLSRPRRIVENAFGLLASVFRIFRKPIELKVDSTVIDVVLSCV
ncbi:unnamed protein product [Acanthoscelides obtectus]|nr:unnamed protein product [Acanthoscelides obtectus]CAK1626072.1 Protein ANTAGONIST OF LIKE HETEROCHROMATIN PROTEIN 1 [Acanthoscelides obtectus]